MMETGKFETKVNNKTTRTQGRAFSTKTMVTVSLLAGLSYVLMLLESPPFIGFLRLEFSDIPAIIGAFQFGPMAGLAIEFIKNLIKAMTATKTAGIGEFANFIVSVAYVVPAAIIYRKMKNKYKSLITFSVATIVMTIAGFLMNYFVTIPMYASLYGGMENVLAAATSIPAIQDKFTLILYGITPFNIVKGIFLGFVGHHTYKLLKNRL
ncbi:MAG: transporter component [Lachnospiraceae bacterium]|jgi:riboflavin transporter FmnP|nr:transporter component [Lachnospiraceae bacterium]